jgi:hypothetical protein
VDEDGQYEAARRSICAHQFSVNFLVLSPSMSSSD